ncbi:MAG TPA: cache domain-containing protein [Puia sp.]|jgi:hypothetical protein
MFPKAIKLMGENKVIRRIIPVMLTLLVLGVFLSLYFLKYLPQQKAEYHRRAFLELEQIEKAAQSRNNAYTRALNYIRDETYVQRNPKLSGPLFRSFKDITIRSTDPDYNRLLQKATMFLAEDPLTGNYRLTYPLPSPGPDTSSIRNMSVRLDSVLNPIISTYKDIFDNYLLIGRPGPENGSEDRILYNPDNLSLDFHVNTDSLLGKSDGFSIRNVRDVTIQGTPYKLFIYPFQLGKQSIILAGLTTSAHYADAYTDMPLDLLIPASIIILLLLINFPILKVFILGIYERITDMDIRLIIGSYFIAAIAGFFLFSWLFLLRIQRVDNQSNLEALSAQVQDNFLQELGLITSQLKAWDTIYASQQGRGDTVLLNGMSSTKLASTDSIALDRLYHPALYPWSDYTFWIDSTGKWLAAWSERKYNNRPLLLRVDDRKYFKDFLDRKYLLLPGKDTPCPFTIQPTLSRLDGEYTISVMIPSKARPAMLVGLTTQMVSVTNTLLPPGYNFSIIDETGMVLYDSRQGRALLSNILKESDDPEAILESSRFRSRRYINEFLLKGQKVALVAAPMKILPYTILTYYNLNDTDNSQLHLIGLAASFSSCVLLLLILSTIINEWTGKKPGMLLAPSNHFEWLRPLPHKEKYYRRLIVGMLSMLAVYILSWCIIKSLPRELEFSLFFISLSLPFYTALYYYTLREKQKQPGKRLHQLLFARPLIPILLFLSLILVVLMSFSTSDTLSARGTPWISLIVQAFLLLTAGWFISTFRPAYANPASPPTFTGPLRSSTPPSETHGSNWLKYYAAAIVTGVVLISIIPSCGIFWLLSWQESSLQNNSSRIAMARAVNIRRLGINNRMVDYKSALEDTGSPIHPDSPAHLQLKFHHGIYLLPGDALFSTAATNRRPFFPLSSQYQDIHRLIFPDDSNVLSSTAHPNAADDSTWSFFTDQGPYTDRVWLEYDAPTDRIDNGPLLLQANMAASSSSLNLISRQTGSTGALFIFLYFGAQLLSVFLAYKVTVSLATRVFMIDLFEDLPCPPDGSNAENAGDGWLENIRNAENNEVSQETILCNLKLHEKLYAQLWRPLSPMEKFVLYDLAKDGFTNYRTGSILWQLQKKNLLVFSNGLLEPVTNSFREYILARYNDEGVVACMKKSRQDGTWQSFKLPLTILFTAFGLFIFFTQGAVYQKLGGLLTSLLSMGSQITTLFDKSPRQPVPEPKDMPGEEAGN